MSSLITRQTVDTRAPSTGGKAVTTTPLASPRPLYDLAFDPDGTSWTARENLTDILTRELLGPAHGDEELLEASPDSLYLVGRIAPTKLTSGALVNGQSAAEKEEPTDDDLVADDEARLGRGVAVGEDVGVAGGADDEGVEDSPARRGMMIPASMGLRFQVSADLEAVAVHASWGTYRSENVDDDGAALSEPLKRPRRRFRRTPRHHTVVIAVASLTPGNTETVPLEGDVVLRVDVADSGNVRVVEVALCNDRVALRPIPTDAWLYQTQLHIEAAPNSIDKDVFLPVSDVVSCDILDRREPELARLQLQYRNRLEFAIGRTCSANWAVSDPSTRRARQVRTTWLPVVETPQTRAHEIAEAELDMRALASATADTLDAGLRPIVREYEQWINQQVDAATSLPSHLRDVAEDAITDARQSSRQLSRGLDFLLSSADAQRCFAFMNQVMADQRVRSQIAEMRSGSGDEITVTSAANLVANRGARAHSWRTFQLAFILMQIEALSNPALARRSAVHSKAELLFFPTGGGKTEAYLGLAAYTLAARRLAGVIDSPDGPLDGESGVAILMRYTLRLLTAQQFQRATAMVCAAEMVRRRDPTTWGVEPFRIGLWVGSAVSPKRYDEAKDQLARAREGYEYGLTVLQLKSCPWCGTRIAAANIRPDDESRRIRVYCGDRYSQCPFSDGGHADNEGLPILTVDEEIYRLTPCFVIATVDKFARLAREGEAASLFGYVRKRCDRHGYIHDDQTGNNKPCTVDVGGKHPPSRSGSPAAYVRPCGRLRPPDLIIQDELHLITGALGTVVGTFELAIDALSSWHDANGAPVRPLVVASTATVRNAAAQIKALYGRAVNVFPPQVLDVADTFFSREVPVTAQNPGRRYMGVSTTGVRLTTAEIEVTSLLLSAGQLLLDRDPPVESDTPAADPYLTMVGYFNATRELAGMARYLSDDIQTKVAWPPIGRNFPFRFGTDSGLNIAELTSRVSSAVITDTLAQMALGFGSSWHSTAGRQQRAAEAREARETKKRVAPRPTPPFDVVLATSMLQVGVDVTRLGLMLMVGQPKNTAEYIQATSRVGRDPARPALVVSLGNWARPRDLAHFEQFRYYHETFYSQVEPLSVTPDSLTALERSLDGVLVSAVRVIEAARSSGLSPERAAGRIIEAEDRVCSVIDSLVARAEVAFGVDVAKEVRDRLTASVANWRKRREWVKSANQTLVYERVPPRAEGLAPLMRSLEAGRMNSRSPGDPPFAVANSMREVQPEVNLLVSPLREAMLSPEIRCEAPNWRPQGQLKGSGND